MIQIELTARVMGVTEETLERVGDLLDAFRAAVTYDTVNGVLYASATVERMSMFLAFDNVLRNELADAGNFPDRMAYSLTNPA